MMKLLSSDLENLWIEISHYENWKVMTSHRSPKEQVLSRLVRYPSRYNRVLKLEQ
jgi:hypothetical protein